MQRVRTTTAAATLPALKHSGTPGYFTEGVPGSTPATVPGQDWFNQIQEELIHLITYAGLTASDADFQQVRKAVIALAIANAPACFELVAPGCLKIGTTYIQWGYIERTGTTTTVTFPVAYPTNPPVFLFYSKGDISAINFTTYVGAVTKTTADCTWFGNGWGGSSGSIFGHYWFAIGN